MSTSPWKRIPNASWGEEHKLIFNDKKGFVIAERHGSKRCLATVIQPLGLSEKEVEAHAKLIEIAPLLLDACIQAEKHHQGKHSEIGYLLREVIALSE